ncbi:NAD kinase [Agrococcus sp. ARC_14]|uniref:NAD kinase n=1 Tax=Agrococcus sp. ARC_14 TaxID=2919927 RepID=UPI001F0552F2|nr:NAD kinase [Agrococcus sp. ARC_14]MCH1883571.1 NAD kinase [Agrococcus sp. ARC_14]
MSDRRFLLAFHPGRAEAVETAATIARRLLAAQVTPVVLVDDRAVLLEGRDGLDAVEPHGPADLPEVELIMTLGGDGTILRAAELQRQVDAPLLGINLGHVGFLAEAEVADTAKVVERALQRDYEVEQRLVLRVKVFDGDVLVHETWAVNEAAVEKAGSGRMISTLLEIDDRPISSFGTDAVILATPTGSTAYSFSAGGPIVWPTAEALLMVPLGAHALFTRPLVVAPTSTMSVTIAEESTSPAVLWCDSRRSFDLPQGYRVEATRDTRPLRLARLSSAPFSDRLVAKFQLPVEGFRRQLP